MLRIGLSNQLWSKLELDKKALLAEMLQVTCIHLTQLGLAMSLTSNCIIDIVQGLSDYFESEIASNELFLLGCCVQVWMFVYVGYIECFDWVWQCASSEFE